MADISCSDSATVIFSRLLYNPPRFHGIGGYICIQTQLHTIDFVQLKLFIHPFEQYTKKRIHRTREMEIFDILLTHVFHFLLIRPRALSNGVLGIENR